VFRNGFLYAVATANSHAQIFIPPDKFGCNYIRVKRIVLAYDTMRHHIAQRRHQNECSRFMHVGVDMPTEENLGQLFRV
jgi:hypothetical protein